MDSSGGKMIIVMILVALLLGALVLIFNPNYRVNKISETNQYYEPQINDYDD